MIIYYPKKYNGNQIFSEPDFIEYYEEGEDPVPTHNGLVDSFCLMVVHKEGWVGENYGAFYESGIHHYMINVDCGHHSKNLERLINNLKQWEDIWNAR